MRRLMAAAVSCLLAGCIPVPVVTVHVVDAQAVVRAGLTQARERIAKGRGRLRRGGCGGDECIAARDVAKLLDAVRNDLRKSFPHQAEPLLVEVETELAAQAGTFGPPKTIDGVMPAKSGGSQTGYDAGAVARALDRMIQILDKFLSVGQLALTLDVQTDPNDAQFLIQIPSNDGTRRSVTTNSVMPNVWRGIYTATVSKRGFKDAVTTVDLINDGRTQVSCTLVPRDARDDSVCHVQ